MLAGFVLIIFALLLISAADHVYDNYYHKWYGLGIFLFGLTTGSIIFILGVASLMKHGEGFFRCLNLL